MGKIRCYPLVICYIAIENGPVEIVDFPINSMVIFHSFLYVYQRVRCVVLSKISYLFPAGPASVLIGGIASPVATNLVDFLDLIRYYNALY